MLFLATLMCLLICVGGFMVNSLDWCLGQSKGIRTVEVDFLKLQNKEILNRLELLENS